MKNATYETRIRIYIDMRAGDGTHPENVTMTAAAWNSVSSAYFESAERHRELGLHALAKRYEEIANKIHGMLDMRGFYKDCK